MRRCLLVVGSVTVGGLLGCSDGVSSGSSEVTVRDSAGVVIVENGDVDLTRELLAAPAPMLEIGVVDGAEEYQLFEVSDAKRLADGGIAVANAGSWQLKIFNRDGTHRATVGGSGEGPSEFRYPVGVQVGTADTIVVQDRLDRVVFTSSGAFVRRETTDAQAMSALADELGGRLEGGMWLADGSYFTPVYEPSNEMPPPGPPMRPWMMFLRVGADLTHGDTLGVFGGILQQFIDIGEEWPMNVVPPYPSLTSWGVGSSLGDVLAADNAQPQFEVFTTEGGHIIARWNGVPEPIGQDEVEAWKEYQRNAPWTQGRLPRLERAWLSMTLPESKPYYGMGVTGSDGVVWLGPREEEGSGWMAFGRDGRYLGFASLPAGFTPKDSGPGWVLGVYRDDIGVEFVRVYGLVDQ